MNWNRSVDKRWQTLTQDNKQFHLPDFLGSQIFKTVPGREKTFFFCLDEPPVLKITTEKTLQRGCSTRCKRDLTPQASRRTVTNIREEYNRSLAVRVECLEPSWIFVSLIEVPKEHINEARSKIGQICSYIFSDCNVSSCSGYVFFPKNNVGSLNSLTLS